MNAPLGFSVTQNVDVRIPHCKPDWCGFEETIYHKVGQCLSSSLYNIYTTYLDEARCLKEIGLGDKADDIFEILNKLNHLSYFFLLLFIQHNINGDEYEKYISCEEIQCIKEQMLCCGIDVTCLFECINICDYIKDCDKCQEKRM